MFCYLVQSYKCICQEYFFLNDLITSFSLRSTFLLILAKGNPPSICSNTVERRYVFNSHNVENVRLGVAEVADKVVNNCKSILILGKIAIGTIDSNRSMDQ